MRFLRRPACERVSGKDRISPAMRCPDVLRASSSPRAARTPQDPLGHSGVEKETHPGHRSRLELAWIAVDQAGRNEIQARRQQGKPDRAGVDDPGAARIDLPSHRHAPRDHQGGEQGQRRQHHRRTLEVAAAQRKHALNAQRRPGVSHPAIACPAHRWIDEPA